MRLLRVVLTFALICACTQSLARVAKSPWADPPPPRVPGLIPGSGIGLPSSLESDKDVYLVITITTADRKIFMTALARKSVEPEELASVLDQVARGTSLPRRTVYWERAGDYSVAFQNASPTYFLSRKLDMRIPVGALVSGVRAAGLHPHALLRVDGDRQIRGPKPSSVVMEGYRWYNISSVPADTLAELSILLPWSASNSLKVIGLLSAFPLAALSFLIIAVVVAKCGRIPANRRRAWYTGVYAGGISFVLITFCVAVFAFWDKASETLFRNSSSLIVMLCVVPAEAALMLAMLGAGWVIGLRILPPPQSGTNQKELFPLAPIWWIIMMALFQPLYRFVSRQAEGYSIVVGAVILIGFFALWMLFSSRIALLWVKNRLALCPVDKDLTARAMGIARAMGVSIKDVRIDPTENGRCYAKAMVFIRQGYLIVTQKSVDVLGPREMDWVLAHEVAHVKDGYPRARGLLALGLLVLALSGMIAMLKHEVGGIQMAVGLILLFAVAIIFCTLDLKYSRQQELAADRRALIATNCLRPAEAALMHISESLPDPRMAEKDTTHPALSKRLAALRMAATELGIPAEPPPQASD